MGIIVLGMVAVLVIAALRANAANANEEWKQAASELGLELQPATIFSGPRITGRGLTIAGGGQRSTFATFTYIGLPWEMSFGQAGLWEAGSVAGARVLTGDPLFDERIKVRGEEDDVVALLDFDTRSRIETFVDAGGGMGWGKLTLKLQGSGRKLPQVVKAARVMLSLGERLERPGRKQQLLANVTSDPAPGVRAKSLQLLADHFPQTAEAKSAIHAALDDKDPSVSLLAAGLDRTDKGQRVLRGVIVDARVAAELRAAAFERLVAVFGYAQDLATLALEQPDWRLRRAAVVAVGAADDLAQLERVCALAGEEPAALGEAVAETLGKLGDVRGEAALIALLGREADPVRVAAAHALGAIGTVGAVERLLPLTRGLLHGDVHAAARDAIRRIQDRLGDAEAGRLSLSGNEGGELSVAMGGELSRVKS